MLRRWLATIVTVSAMMFANAPLSLAQDDASAFKDLSQGQDYRVRVTAALLLGKSKAAGARPALEKALGDSHPSVRAAAAAGLGALGDAAAIPALQTAERNESVATVKAQMATTIKRLSGATTTAAGKATTGKAKFLVALGKIENRTAVKDAAILTTLKASTREKMRLVSGVEVLDEADIVTASKSRGLPGFTLDTSLTKLQQLAPGQGTVSYAARVEYLIKKLPEHALKGTMSGSVEVQDAKSADRAALERDAIGAAVDAALKGATPALEAATR